MNSFGPNSWEPSIREVRMGARMETLLWRFLQMLTRLRLKRILPRFYH